MANENAKSAKVRGFILESKQAGHTEIGEALIQRTMLACGFKRQLARAYLKNNWPKVTLEGAAQQAAEPAAGAETQAAAEEVAAPVKMTLEEALATIPLREKGKFIKKEVRLAQAQALIDAQ